MAERGPENCVNSAAFVINRASGRHWSTQITDCLLCLRSLQTHFSSLSSTVRPPRIIRKPEARMRTFHSGWWWPQILNISAIISSFVVVNAQRVTFNWTSVIPVSIRLCAKSSSPLALMAHWHQSCSSQLEPNYCLFQSAAVSALY